MPLPILLGAIGVYGAVKTIGAVVDNSNAKDANANAGRIVRSATRDLDKAREATNAALEQFGTEKLKAFDGPIAQFLETYGRLKNVEFAHTEVTDTLDLDNFSTDTLPTLRADLNMLQTSGLGLGAGLTGGAAAAFGAYSGTMALATASTGTAISTLSGAAATNATLAWLGGGTLAAGGSGVVGGMMVMGGLVAAPALAIMGFIMGSKAEEALNDALSNESRAKTYRDEVALLIKNLTAVQKVTVLATETLVKLSAHFETALKDLKGVLEAEGENYSNYAQTSREVVLRNVKFAQLLKAIIDAPILDEDGSLVLATQKSTEEIATFAAELG